jgi:hypothetical protein
MSQSGSGKPDPVFRGGGVVFSSREVDRLVLVPKWHHLLNGVDLSCMNSVTGSVYRAKCSNILQDRPSGQ